jgi:hypothetical protein
MSDQNDLPQTPKPEEFRDLTSLLFRRAPPPTGSPALTQHFAYRIPDLYAAEPSNWLDRIEKFLEDLQTRLSKPDVKNFKRNPVPINKDPSRRYRTARVRFSWRSIPVTLSFEVHREYLTASAVMDLSGWELDETDAIAGRLHSAIRGFDQIANARNTKIKNKDPIGRGEDRDQLRIPHDVIFTETWDAFCGEILKTPLENIGDDLGERFAAGRGFVASLAGTQDPEHFILLPGHGVKINRADPGRPFKRSENEHEDFRCAHAVLPLLRAGRDAFDLEYSASQLDGNCLYLSALGAKPPEPPEPPEPPPAPIATFLLLATHPNPHQLGWMIDRFNDLGVVRRAGLFDLPQLVRADSALRQIEPHLDRTRAQRAKEAGDEPVAIAQFTKDDLSDVYARLDKAARGQGEDRIQGSLPDRVVQSGAYWQQFNQMLGDLRILPVGDFRVYSELANRRIGDTYGAIASIGDHYHELMGKMSEYNRQLISNELRDVQVKMSTHVKTIADLQGMIVKLTDASVAQATKIDEQTTASKDLLQNAEWGFWAVLFPYYSSTFLLHNVLGEKRLAAMNQYLDKGLDKILNGHARPVHYVQHLYHPHIHHDHDLAQLYIASIMLLIGFEGACKFPVSKAASKILTKIKNAIAGRSAKLETSAAKHGGNSRSV